MIPATFRTICALLGLCAPLAAHADPRMDLLRVPQGFSISLVSGHVPNARAMARGARGTIFVGSRAAGTVYALTGVDDGGPVKVHVLARGLDMPVGVAYHNGDLYVSDTKRIVVLHAIEDHLDTPPRPQVVADGLPYRDGDHSWKFIAFGPDNRLYVPIGAPCNICDVGHEYGRLISMAPDGTDRRDVAYGIRNTVGFTWQPGTDTLWFTDNGRDMMGDDVPSDELDRLDTPGQSFGYPYCHQGNIPDPQFGSQHACSAFTPPALLLGAHVAALGLRFYEGSAFPAAYHGNLMIAEHGSWNRSQLSGYQVVSVHFGPDSTPQPPTVLVSGFRQGQTAWGRPADVLPLPDGSMLISDDMAGAVYRLSYGRQGYGATR
ncbi:PQQ-dependent sugar dehydrogenase [Komagataeibacter medellinensis]|uniref:L-sorbosone dehydrogenase n=1 Tax=Komagataeibacter medellinensis (strain NBRC 3288 / BCRC 11682 / LMG 1693 / Kondo 51) TaxID=634177 RepID=G2I3Y4_KOMMN|nr:PQQ-dependent sugar dehydrogenase [Komagataeibacter medellinensis]BAK82831.1 L-sorbosone dehydrogenase [Komagataeibacter medellinensis NBRC 3288]